MIKQASNRGDISLETVCQILDNHKAHNVSVIDLSTKTTFADYMIVASGTSQRHLSSLGDHLMKHLKQPGQSHMEGRGNSDWILVDLGNVVVHLFRPEIRQMYDLEGMWNMPALVSHTC